MACDIFYDIRYPRYKPAPEPILKVVPPNAEQIPIDDFDLSPRNIRAGMLIQVNLIS